KILLAHSPGGDTLTYQWFPHRFVRETQAEGLRFRTETFMPAKRRAAAQLIRVKNVANSARNFTLGFDMRAGVANKTTAWFINSPGESDNAIHWDSGRGALIFTAQHSPAVSVQGTFPKPSRLDFGRMLSFDVALGPGETKEFHYVNVIEGTAEAALAA